MSSNCDHALTLPPSSLWPSLALDMMSDTSRPASSRSMPGSVALRSCRRSVLAGLSVMLPRLQLETLQQPLPAVNMPLPPLPAVSMPGPGLPMLGQPLTDCPARDRPLQAGLLLRRLRPKRVLSIRVLWGRVSLPASAEARAAETASEAMLAA